MASGKTIGHKKTINYLLNPGTTTTTRTGRAREGTAGTRRTTTTIIGPSISRRRWPGIFTRRT
eukprot:8822682-Pyramimonas_sp.AAC.1